MIGKRIPALQQLRKGMELLQVLEVIEANASLFEPLFVYQHGQLSVETVKAKLKFDKTKDDHAHLHQFFMRFLQNANFKELESFWIFCRGSRQLPSCDIHVSYKNCGFASILQKHSFTVV